MDNKKKLNSFTDGTYIFQETENENQFYFYRADGEVLGEIDSEPMEMYQKYICMKMMEKNVVPEIVANNIRFDTSDDGKCIRLTTFAILKKEIVLEQQKEKGIKKLVKSILGKK
ncbi:MAG: hypothetical protein PHF30_02470 [Bacilli bacterium]|nr:hypothetical protein [Bacilli bacterium]